MPGISSFALQYTNVDYAAVAASSYDMFITEGDPLNSAFVIPTLTDAQVVTLVAQGRQIIGYVNVSVTDDLRSYWNNSWTSNGGDTGTPTAAAPSWLQGALPLDFTFDGNTDALIVNYWDPAWQQSVIAQAVDLVTRGYTGVFLDDVGRYFQVGAASGNFQLAADRMIDLIGAVHDAITAVNPLAVVVLNSDPYLIVNNSAGGTGDQRLLDSADYHLLENQTTTVADFARSIMPGEPLLLLQSTTPGQLTLEEAWARGILYNSPTLNYDQLGAFAYPATAGADVERGGNVDDRLFGLAGDDTLLGFAANDRLNGDEGNDVLNGGTGADVMTGGTGNDIYFVDQLGDSVTERVGEGVDEVRAAIDYSLGDHAENLRLQGTARVGTGNALDNVILAGGGPATLNGLGGNDTLTGSASGDMLNGGTGDDLIFGRNGNDIINGGDGNDIVRGEVGSDILSSGAGDDSAFGGDGQDAMTGGDGNDILRGEGQNDTLFGDAGADTLQGGDGNDTLYGGAGRDVMSGGLGLDNFWFDEGDFAGLTNTTADRIQDFVQGQDRIRLTDIDANTSVAGDQAFVFIGASAFTNTAGELRYTQSGGVTLLEGDVDGDGAADFAIALSGNIGLLGTDFTL